MPFNSFYADRDSVNLAKSITLEWVAALKKKHVFWGRVECVLGSHSKAWHECSFLKSSFLLPFNSSPPGKYSVKFNSKYLNE